MSIFFQKSSSGFRVHRYALSESCAVMFPAKTVGYYFAFNIWCLVSFMQRSELLFNLLIKTLFS